jgi:hypothetical protein
MVNKIICLLNFLFSLMLMEPLKSLELKKISVLGLIREYLKHLQKIFCKGIWKLGVNSVTLFWGEGFSAWFKNLYLIGYLLGNFRFGCLLKKDFWALQEFEVAYWLNSLLNRRFIFKSQVGVVSYLSLIIINHDIVSFLFANGSKSSGFNWMTFYLIAFSSSSSACFRAFILRASFFLKTSIY